MYNDENREFDPVGWDLPPQPQQDRTDLPEEPDEIVSWYTPAGGAGGGRQLLRPAAPHAPERLEAGRQDPAQSAAVCGRGWA